MYSKNRITGSSSSTNKSNRNKASTNNAVMYSAALQDHLMKKGNFKIDSELLGHKPIKTKFPTINKKPHSNKDILSTKAESEINKIQEK